MKEWVIKVKVIRKLVRNEKAQSLVEFALILPLLLVILLGIIEFGWFFNAKITLTSAAREGVRVYAIMGSEEYTNAEISNAVTDAINKATSGLLLEGGKATYIPGGPTQLAGNPEIETVNITVSGTVKSLTNFFNFITGGAITMKSSASMRIEY